MEQQLTFAFSSDADAQNLYRHLESALKADGECGIRTECLGRHVAVLAEPRSGGKTEGLAERTAAWVADYVINEVEARLLRRLAADSVVAAPEEIEQMVVRCRQILNESDGGGPNAGRRETVRRALMSCLAEQSSLNVDGFLRFRLRGYIENLRDITDYAVNEFVLNRQYREFIDLLRYFVHFHESRIAEAHLIHDGGNRFMLFDGGMRPLEVIGTEEVTVETIDRELNVEDMVVSALISVLPAKIHLHTREPRAASVQTIRQIFEERVKICHWCRVCAPLLGERKNGGENGVPLDR